MKMKITYLLACIFLSLTSMAQVKIAGKVSSSKDGSPLSNVSVVIKGTTTGTTTDNDGLFQIEVPSASSILVFSSAGFTAKEVEAGSQTTLNVVLEAKANILNEVVVIGYGTASRTDLTGAVSSIKAEKLMDAPVPNITQALEGKIPA